MENKKNIELISGGIVCDNPNCDWRDNSVNSSDYKNWIGATCPKCSSIVFTESDYNESVKIMAMVELINSMTIEEMETIAKMSDLHGKDFKEQLKSIPFFKDAEGIDEIEEGKDMTFLVSSLGGLKCTEIKNLDENGSE